MHIFDVSEKRDFDQKRPPQIPKSRMKCHVFFGSLASWKAQIDKDF